MPYARVGVIPPLSTKNDQQSSQMSGGKRSARRKGITMEDLKKLTALRLAQEQQQHNQSTDSSAFAEYPSNPSVTTQLNDQQRTFPLANNNGSTVVHLQPPMVAAREVVPLRASPVAMAVVDPTENDSYIFLQVPAPPDVHDLQASTGSMLAKKKVQRKATAVAPLVMPNPAIQDIAQPVMLSQEQLYQQRSPEIPSSRSSQAGSPQLDTAYQGSGQQNSSSKSKLPHGLTVHELKEMTKARLQAEAAEKNETVHFQQPRGSPSPRLSSPNQHLFMHSVESPSQIHTVHEHHSDLYPPPSPAFANFGSSMQINAALSEVSESDFGGSNFDRSRSSGMNPNRECWQQQSKTDTWETASVASYNSAVASDYIGSESPFTPVVGGMSAQMVDDLGNVPFGRSRSYPTSGGFSLNSDYPLYDSQAPSSSSSLGNVYVAVGPNRRRACTLSPRPGLGNLHEDRPMLSCEGLGMPTFAANTTRNQINPRVPNSFSPILSNSQYPESFRPFGSFNDTISRPRTLSTASLPPLSHTADEFALEGPSQLHYSMGPPITPGFSDPRHSAMESFLHSARNSLPSSANTSNGVSAVFRDSGMGEDLRAPPGLFGGTELHAMSTSSSGGLNLVQSSTSSLDTFGESKVSNLDSTWGASHGSVFPLGTGMIQPPSDPMDATLAGDLNSILKLSGAAEEPDPVMPPAPAVGFNDINGLSNRPFGF